MYRILFILALSIAASTSFAQPPVPESPVLLEEPKAEALTWYSMEEAQRMAKEDGKKVLIFGDAKWCTYCKKMKKEVYPDPTVISTINTYFYPVILDSESSNTITFNDFEFTEQELAIALRMSGTPTHYFVSSEGEMLGKQPGFIPADLFTQLLGFVGSDSYQNQTFDDYIGEGQ